MAYGNPTYQKDISPHLYCNAQPAVFDMKNGSIYFVPRQPRYEPNIVRNFHFQNFRTVGNEHNWIQQPRFITHQSYASATKMIQGSNPLSIDISGRAPIMAQNVNSSHHFLYEDREILDFHLPANQNLGNGLNLIQRSHLLQLQLSSNGVQSTESFQEKNQFAEYESNIFQHSNFLAHQLPSVRIGMNQNSNLFIHHTSGNISNISAVKDSTTFGFSPIEPRRNQINHSLPYQKSTRESIIRQGLKSIFQNSSEDRLNVVQNPQFPSSQTFVNHSSDQSVYITKNGFNTIQDIPSIQHMSPSDINLDLNSTLYTENVHICVIGPPGCGKDDLIRTFAGNENIHITTDKPLNKAFQKGMVSFHLNINLTIDIWKAEDLHLAAKDLRSLGESKKSAFVLVYSATKSTSLIKIIEWIKLLKFYENEVPIILVENNTHAESEHGTREFSGAEVLEKYKLTAFYQCSTELVNKVEELFLFAAHKASRQKIQRSAQ